MATRGTINNIIAAVRTELLIQRQEGVLGGHARLILNHVSDLLKDAFPGNVALNQGFAQVLQGRLDTILSVSIHAPRLVLALRCYLSAWQVVSVKDDSLLERGNEHWNEYLAHYRTMKADRKKEQV